MQSGVTFQDREHDDHRQKRRHRRRVAPHLERGLTLLVFAALLAVVSVSCQPLALVPAQSLLASLPTLEALRALIPEIALRPRYLATDEGAASAPGQMIKHYSPRAPVRLYTGADLDRVLAAVLVHLVADGHLRLAVRPQIRQRAILAHRGQTSTHLVRQHDRHRHILRRLIAGEAEHHPLIAGPDRLDVRVAHLAGLGFQRLVDPQRDVSRLFLDGNEHAAGVGVEAVFGARVADLADRVARDQDVVVAITSGVSDMQAVLNAVWDHLLPAMGPVAQPSPVASEKAATDARLRTRVARLEVPRAPGGPDSPAAKRLHGKRYVLDANEAGLAAAVRDIDMSAVRIVEEGGDEESVGGRDQRAHARVR